MSLPPLHTGTGAIVTIVKRSNGGYHLMPNYKQKSTETSEPKDHTVTKISNTCTPTGSTTDPKTPPTTAASCVALASKRPTASTHCAAWRT